MARFALPAAPDAELRSRGARVGAALALVPAALWIAFIQVTQPGGLVVSRLVGAGGILLVGAAIGWAWAPRAATRSVRRMLALAIAVALSGTALGVLVISLTWSAEILVQAGPSVDVLLVVPYATLQNWLMGLVALGVPILLASLPLAVLWCWLVGVRSAGGAGGGGIHGVDPTGEPHPASSPFVDAELERILARPPSLVTQVTGVLMLFALVGLVGCTALLHLTRAPLASDVDVMESTDAIIGEDEVMSGLPIGQGIVDDVPWQALITVSADGYCTRVRHDADVSACVWGWGPPPDPFLVVSGSRHPAIVHGVVRDDVARVRIETSTEAAEFDVVSLVPLGIPSKAFGGPVPKGAAITLVALDTDGNELGRLVSTRGRRTTCC